MVPGVCTIVVRAGDGTLTSTSALVVNVLPVPGTVDTRFGGGRGFVTRGAVGRAAVGTDMVIDASGRLVVAGALVRAGVATDEDLAIWRLMPDGTTDTTFAGGRVTHHGAAGGVGDDRAWGVAVDPVGNVVAAGESCRGGGPCGPADIDIAVWRYRDNGTLDTTFSGDGIYTANPSGDFDTANDVSVSTIGGQTRITVVGNGFFNSAAEPNIVALRLDNAGALDRTFDGDGILSFDELGAESALAAHGVFDANERKLLVAGSIEIISGDREMFFWRFRQNGAKDNTFGTRCMIDTDIADNVGCWTSAVQRDDVAQDITTDGMGRVVVVGVTQTNTGAFDMIVWRTSAAGVPDTTFGVGGAWWRVFDFGPDDSAEAVTVDAMGRIVIVGFSRSPRGDDDLLVMRLLPSGAVDPAFGVNGILRHDRGAGDERGFAVTIDGQGRILVAGRSRSLAGDDEMTIWRINP